ncbi:molybdopterin molybdotransferase MoeA [Clostridium chrysemydis]|uniref:molybdopterin molybdotransferase MoeA n=1 Tax=Clostridium chrysemydis TaxID=2665504 RepID=UPI0018845075|nr:molybdopterin molybdotransferase MoeA [Clostridium chrysemydis]
MVSLEEAEILLLNKTPKLKIEEVSLEEATGRVLSEDIFAKIDNPPFNRSPLDGYAIIAEDTFDLKDFVFLKVIDTEYAGHISKKTVKPKTAIKITTGAKIPEGANTVVRKEDTEFLDGYVKVYKSLKPYENFCFKGEDYKEGQKLISKNTKITASEVMAIASLGIKKVKVYKKPVIGIINTGDEVQDLGETLKEGKIYNSNGYFLKSRVSELGCIGKIYNIICDSDEEIIKAIKELEEFSDIIISTGGVSVGEKDRVKESVVKALYDILFWKVDMKPGSPMFAASKGDKLYIGLSGTPVAAATSFELTGRKVIENMLNQNYNYKKNCILKDEFLKVTSKRRFLRVYVNNQNEVFINSVYQTPGQVHTMINSNGILEIPKNKELKLSEKVNVLML